MKYNDDVIDVRDLIERYEELEAVRDDEDTEYDDRVEAGDEMQPISDVLEDLAGGGGDAQWRGDWYPVTLIRDSYFVEYASQLAEDIGAINSDLSWPANCIDWKQAARELQMDYSSVDIQGRTYWYC